MKQFFPPFRLLAAERGLSCRSFDSHMRSKLLQCGEDTHILQQVHDTRVYRGITRLGSARTESKFGVPRVEFEVFRKQKYWIEENTCDIVWTFWRPCSQSALPIVIRRPGNCAPLFEPLRPYECQLVLQGFEIKELAAVK